MATIVAFAMTIGLAAGLSTPPLHHHRLLLRTTTDPTTCPAANATTYITPLTLQPYTLYCATDFPGSDLPTYPATNFTACIASCDAYAPNSTVANGAQCVAVVYNAANVNGDKCYRKYAVGWVDADGDGEAVDWSASDALQSARRSDVRVGQGPVYQAFATPGTTAAASATGTPTSTGSNAASASSSVYSDGAGGGLDTGAEIGIGLGIGLFCLLILVLFALFIRRRQRRRTRKLGHDSSQEAVEVPREKKTLDASGNGVLELHGSDINELGVDGDGADGGTHDGIGELPVPMWSRDGERIEPERAMQEMDAERVVPEMDAEKTEMLRHETG